jgi:hypothetical protein
MPRSVKPDRLPRDELAVETRRLVVIVETALCAFGRVHDGLDPEEHPELFHPFLRAAAAGQAGVMVQ